MQYLVVHDNGRNFVSLSEALGASPASALGEFEVEAAEQGISATVHLDHSPQLRDKGHSIFFYYVMSCVSYH